MNIHSSPRTGSGKGLIPTASSFSRDLYEIGQRYRDSSSAFNRALDAIGMKEARKCANALIDLRVELQRQITMVQQLENKLQFALQDDWENSSEVYRD